MLTLQVTHINTFPFLKEKLTIFISLTSIFIIFLRCCGLLRSSGAIIWCLNFSVGPFCNVSDYDDRNVVITEQLLRQGYRLHKLLKTFH